MGVIVVDMRLVLPGFFLSVAGVIAVINTGFLSASSLLVILGVAVVVLSVAKPFPETEGLATWRGEYGRWLGPASAVLFGTGFALLGLAVVTSFFVPPIPFAVGYQFYVSQALLSVWPWVLLASLIWVPKRALVKRVVPAND